MRSRVYVTVGRPSVRPSVCLSHRLTATTACGGLRSATSVGSVMLTAELTRLNTDLFISYTKQRISIRHHRGFTKGAANRLLRRLRGVAVFSTTTENAIRVSNCVIVDNVWKTCCWYSRGAEMSFGRNTNNPVYVIFVRCDKRTSATVQSRLTKNYFT